MSLGAIDGREHSRLEANATFRISCEAYVILLRDNPVAQVGKGAASPPTHAVEEGVSGVHGSNTDPLLNHVVGILDDSRYLKIYVVAAIALIRPFKTSPALCFDFSHILPVSSSPSLGMGSLKKGEGGMEKMPFFNKAAATTVHRITSPIRLPLTGQSASGKG